MEVLLDIAECFMTECDKLWEENQFNNTSKTIIIITNLIKSQHLLITK